MCRFAGEGQLRAQLHLGAIAPASAAVGASQAHLAALPQVIAVYTDGPSKSTQCGSASNNTSATPTACQCQNWDGVAMFSMVLIRDVPR